MCFEVLGFDIILDSNLKPWLLEVNHTPSFVTDSPFDHILKKNLLLDTLLILNVNNKEKKRYLIYPQNDQNRYIESRGTPYKERKNNKIDLNELESLQQKVVKWENAHLGGYIKLFPLEWVNNCHKVLNSIGMDIHQF